MPTAPWPTFAPPRATWCRSARWSPSCWRPARAAPAAHAGAVSRRQRGPPAAGVAQGAAGWPPSWASTSRAGADPGPAAPCWPPTCSGRPPAAAAAAGRRPRSGRRRRAVPSGSVWRIMAERTTQSWQTAPHFFLHRQVDAGRLNSWREAAVARPAVERASHTDLLVMVAAAALRRHPGGERDLGWRRSASCWTTSTLAIAVATDAGLVVPVVHLADTLSLSRSSPAGSSSSSGHAPDGWRPTTWPAAPSRSPTSACTGSTRSTPS